MIKYKNRISFNGGIVWRIVKSTNRREFYKQSRVKTLVKAYMMCTRKDNISYHDFMTRILEKHLINLKLLL